MGLTNDERGWVMAVVSGIACVCGASIICADLVVRLFPNQRNFHIQDSDAFLSASLSLSFGVMLFSSLYTILPKAKESFEEGGYSPKEAAWMLVAFFLAGVVGIQILSRILHQFIPSHVVDCEHTHDDEESGHAEGHAHAHQDEHEDRGKLGQGQDDQRRRSDQALKPASRRPSLHARLSKTLSAINKPECDSDGPCYGYSEPCGQQCFKIQARGSRASSCRSNSTRHLPPPPSESSPLLGGGGRGGESAAVL